MSPSNCLQEEWKKLPVYQHPSKVPDLYSTALKNLSKNRYSDILAYESTRVKLRDSKEYINANYIDIAGCSISYIATEAPMSNSFDTFWKMIWEKNVQVIVMLTKIFEGRKVKASCYWPTEGYSDQYGDILVSLDSVTEDDNIITRNITITKDKESKKLTHIQYTGWPDFGVPTDISTFVKLVNIIYEFEKKIDDTPGFSIVVHCSAGIGRCGTLLAILAAKYRHEKQKGINMLKIVSSLRNCRAGMVQTKEQYYFIYSVLSSLQCIAHTIGSSSFPTFDLRMSQPNVPFY